MKINSLFPVALLIAIAFTTSAGGQTTFQKIYRAADPAPTVPGAVLQTFDGNYCAAGNVGDNNGDILLTKLAQNGDTLWTRVFGGNLREDFTSMDQTQDSGFILCGGTYSFSSGNVDGYVIRTDASGNLLWSKSYGGVNSDGFNSIRQTADGGFIAAGVTSSFGSGTEDIFLVKLDSAGGVAWTKTIGGSGWDNALSVQQTFDKGYIITGYTTSFTASTHRVYLVKTDSLGVPVWSLIVGGTVLESGQSVRQCRDSGYIVTGYTKSFGTGTLDVFLLKATRRGGLSWMKTYGGNATPDMGFDVEQTADNGFIVVGNTQSFGQDSGSRENVYLIKTDTAGNTLWTRAYTSMNDFGYAVKPTKDTGYIISSWRYGFELIKTDSVGRTSCTSYGTGTITNNVSPILHAATYTASQSVVANSAATLTHHTTMTISAACATVPTTGVSSLSGNAVVADLHPNPFSNTLTLEVDASGISEFMMVNVMSQKVFQEHFDHRRTVSTEGLIPGIYFYELRNAGRLLKSGKLLKQ